MPAAGRSGVQARELAMATELIDQLGAAWKPEAYRDTFKERIVELVERKAKAGEAEIVEPIEAGESPAAASNVVDLTELLKQSLAKPGKRAGEAKAAGKRKRA